MERSTGTKATSDGTRLNRVQMARALREGVGAVDGRDAERRIASAERKWIMDSGLRRVGASVTLGVLLASTLTGGRITALRADFLQHAAAGGGPGGSIPGSPGPSVGSDGKSHSPIQDTNQEQQKKMFSKLTGVTAAISVGIISMNSSCLAENLGFARFSRATDTIELSDSTELYDRYTYEARIRMRGLPGQVTRARIFSEQNGFDTDKALGLESSGGALEVQVGQCCGSGIIAVSAPWASDDQWHHLAVVRTPTSYAVYLDGSIVGFGKMTGGPGPSSGSNRALGAFRYALDGGDPTVQSVNFDLDWIRISNTDRYGGDLFVPPCEGELVPDSATQLLYRFNSPPTTGMRSEGVRQISGSPGTGFPSATAPEFMLHSSAGCSDLHVPTDYPTIQQAINVAQPGSRIIVAPGTYREQISLQGKEITIIGSGGAAVTTIDGEGLRTVVLGAGEPASCEIRGITIANGRHVGDSGGGGVMLEQSSARFVQCRFIANSADGQALWSGGGHFSLGGNPVIEDCYFAMNRGRNQSSGSAIYHYGGGTLTVRRCRFDGNVGNYEGVMGPEPGPTVKVHSQGGPFSGDVEDCVFLENSTGSTVRPDPSNFGGEIMMFLGGQLRVTRCLMIADARTKPCAVGALNGGSIVLSEVSGCGYPRTGNGDVLTNGANLTANCGDCDGDSVPDLAVLIRDPGLDADADGIPDTCECLGDLYLDGFVNGADLGALLAYWGPVTGTPASEAADINRDGTVNGSDLGILLASWGTCGG